MSRADRITILVSAAALCVTIIGKSCWTNAHLDELIAPVGETNARLDARIGAADARLVRQGLVCLANCRERPRVLRCGHG